MQQFLKNTVIGFYLHIRGYYKPFYTIQEL
jgi:hypothetical protein